LKKCLREITKLKEAVQSRGKATQVDKNRRIEELERQVSSLQQTNLKLKENLHILSEQMRQIGSQSQSPRSQLASKSSSPSGKNKNNNRTQPSENQNTNDPLQSSSQTKTNEGEDHKS